MIIDVVPVKRLPRGIGDTFSYNVPVKLEDEIRPGQIVEVDFRNSLRPAVIKTIRKGKPQATLKTVNKLLSPISLITPEQIKLSKWIANYYFTSLATATKLLVPDIPKRIGNYESRIEKIIKPKTKPKPKLIWYEDTDDKEKRVNSEIKKTLEKKQQILWIFPEKYKALKNSHFSVRTEKCDSELKLFLLRDLTSKQKQFNKYLKVLSNKSKLIIGTRSALFAPFQNLGLIILEDEASGLYKSEITPRYHSREVAEELARLHSAKLIFTSTAPSLETYQSYYSHSGGSRRSSRVTIETRDSGVPITSGLQNDRIKIIDIKEERLKENYSSLSDELRNATKTALNNNLQIFLFHNRRGHSTTTICKDCGFTFVCPDCQLPFNYHSGRNLLICHHCRARQELAPFCPKCGSAEIKLTGKGTQKLEQEVSHFFPDSKIIRVDSDIQEESRIKNLELSKKNKKIKKPKFQIPNSKFNIIIGTEYALSDNRVDWSNVALIGVINADICLYRPDFRGSERMYQLLTKLINTNDGQETQLLVQTYNPRNYVIQAIEQNKPELFYKEELKIRNALGYPPFQQVIKLIYRNSNEKKAVGEAMHIYNRLKKHLINEATEKYPIEILKPFPAFERMERGKFKFHLILRIASGTPEKLYEKIRELVPPDWVFDRDPETLL